MTFAAHDHVRRITAVRAALDGLGAQWLLLTARADVRYLSGFTGSAGVVLVGVERAVLVTDGRYALVAGEQAPHMDLVIDRDWPGAAAALVSGHVLAVDPSEITLAEFRRLEAVGETPVLAVSVVRALRQVKDPSERQRIAAACAISDEAFAGVVQRIRPGVTERQIARWMHEAIGDLGAEDLAFPTIVAAGPNGAYPHHTPGDTQVCSGDMVTLDFGARVDGYHSDQTRTVVVGAPVPWQREVFDVVAEAQASARAACTAGISCADLDAVARSVIREAGFADAYPHGLGHGVGLEIHEAPMIGAASTGILSADTLVTIEPGIYLPGRGGVRIEDTVWVSPEGSESLTRSPRELLVLD